MIGKAIIPHLDPAFRTYLTRCSTKPTGAAYNALNHLFKDLRADGNLTKLDYFRMQCQDNQTNAVFNIIANAFNASEVGSPVWTSGRGYTGAAGKYLNTNFNPNTQGVQFTKNSSSIGCYLLDSVAAGAFNEFGANDGIGIIVLAALAAGNLFGELLNDLTFITVANSRGNSQGVYSVVRPNATTVQLWQDGVMLLSTASNSTAVPNLTIDELGRNTSGVHAFQSTNTMAFSWAGSGTIDQLALYKSVQKAARTMGIVV